MSDSCDLLFDPPSMTVFSNLIYITERIFYKLQDTFNPSPVRILSDKDRKEANLPSEGIHTSVETALNSRCSSDSDGNPRKFHWGMFDTSKKLSEKQIRRIIDLAVIPKFSDGKLSIRAEGDMLTFLIENDTSNTKKKWMMIESGMQQQAVGLVCAALGVGMVLKNLGKDGTPVSDTEYATIRAKFGAMQPSYHGSYWSDLPPKGRSSWMKGNLPEPVRNSDKPLLSGLKNLKAGNGMSGTVSEKEMSQILWAARGRTPHFYKTKPWGLTIPIWGGQDLSNVYVLTKGKLYQYVNWYKNRPTHSLCELRSISDALMSELEKSFSVSRSLIVLGITDGFNRSLWETGYQLLNILVQAQALGVSYETVLLDDQQVHVLSKTGVKVPVAVVAV